MIDLDQYVDFAADGKSATVKSRFTGNWRNGDWSAIMLVFKSQLVRCSYMHYGGYEVQCIADIAVYRKMSKSGDSHALVRALYALHKKLAELKQVYVDNKFLPAAYTYTQRRENLDEAVKKLFGFKQETRIDFDCMMVAMDRVVEHMDKKMPFLVEYEPQ